MLQETRLDSVEAVNKMLLSMLDTENFILDFFGYDHQGLDSRANKFLWRVYSYSASFTTHAGEFSIRNHQLNEEIPSGDT